MNSEHFKSPQLLAFLICQEVLFDQAQLPTLVKVMEGFTLYVPQNTGLIQGQSKGSLPLALEAVAFTKWSQGEGEFSVELTLVTPKGEEKRPSHSIKFRLTEDRPFAQIKHEFIMAVHEPGIYILRVYLNGQLRGEHPFKVDFNEAATPTS